MTEKQASCTSCNTRITNTIGSTRFNCPNCGKIELVRCNKCREIAAKYKCQNCNFEGPN